ncbi:hypothetical protein ACHAXT_010112 [Thalassiosira profunda]
MADPHAQLRARLQTEGDAGQVIHDFLDSHANGDGIFEWVRIRRQLAAIHAARREGTSLAETAIPVLQLHRAIQDQTAGSIFSLVRDHAECRELYELFKDHFEVPAPQATGFHALSSTEVVEQIKGHREYEAIATSIVSSLDPAILQAFLPHHVPPSAGAENPHSARTGNSDSVTPGLGSRQLPGTEQLREGARLPRERKEWTMGGDDRSGGSSTASALAQAREEEGSGSAAAAARTAGREVAGSDAIAALTTLQHASWLSPRDRRGGDDSEGRANSEEEEGGEKLVAQEEPDFGGGGDLDYDNTNDDEVELASAAQTGGGSDSSDEGEKEKERAVEETRAANVDDTDDDEESVVPPKKARVRGGRAKNEVSYEEGGLGDAGGFNSSPEEEANLPSNIKRRSSRLAGKRKRRSSSSSDNDKEEAGEEKADSSSEVRLRDIPANNPAPRTVFDRNLKWFGKAGMYGLEIATGTRDEKFAVKVIIGAVGLNKQLNGTFDERIKAYHYNEVSYANVSASAKYVKWMGEKIDELKSSGKLELPLSAPGLRGAKVNINKKSRHYCRADEVQSKKNKAKREAAKHKQENAEYEKKKKAFNDKSFEQKVKWIKKNGKGPNYAGVDWKGGGCAPAFVRDWAGDMRSEMSKKTLSTTKVKLLHTIGIYTSAKSANNKKGDKAREKKRAHLLKFQVDFPGKRPSPELNFPSKAYNLGRLIESGLYSLRYKPPSESLVKTAWQHCVHYHDFAVVRQGLAKRLQCPHHVLV